jgi:hypothetical protein
MDEFEAWLLEQIEWYKNWCLQNAEERGYPGKIAFASQDMRYALESYTDALEKYREFKRDPSAATKARTRDN